MEKTSPWLLTTEEADRRAREMREQDKRACAKADALVFELFRVIWELNEKGKVP